MNNSPVKLAVLPEGAPATTSRVTDYSADGASWLDSQILREAPLIVAISKQVPDILLREDLPYADLSRNIPNLDSALKALKRKLLNDQRNIAKAVQGVESKVEELREALPSGIETFTELKELIGQLRKGGAKEDRSARLKEIRRLTEEYINPLETLEKKIADLHDESKKIATYKDGEEKSLCSRHDAAEKQVQTISEHLKKVFAQFPQGQIIDVMGAITGYKLKDGLPRLAFFEGQSTARIYLSYRAPGSSLFNLKEFKTEKNKFNTSIRKACGVGSETDISIATNLQGIIPTPCVDLLHRARKSKLFNNVGVLGEVHEWKVTYRNCYDETPKIKGIIKNPAPDPDPLIVARMSFSGPLEEWNDVWVLLGAYNETTLEKYIRDEFTTT